MKTPSSIYTKLSNQYNVPYRVVEVICNSPFKFASEAMSNYELKPIRFLYLGKFKLKKKYELKEDTECGRVQPSDISEDTVGSEVD